MKVLTFLLILCAAPAAADEGYFLRARVTEHVGDRWHLLRYGTVTLDAGETDAYWLSLSTCPGGVDSPAELYVNPTSVGSFGWQKGWFHPVAYNGYAPDVQVILSNHSAGPMTFRLKASVRCKLAP